MEFDPGVICFNHCGSKTFCFEIPERCPSCHDPLSTNSSLMPVRVPYPFVRASQNTCAVIIKPTHGNFLHGYNLSDDLHIGVTSSKGTVYEYDRNGLHSDQTESWNQCLVVHQTVGEEWELQWDEVLQQITEKDCWTSHRYNEEVFNCYTFVLCFLKCLKNGLLSEAASSKTLFCELFVSPRVAASFKYINLYRQLKDCGFYVCKTLDLS